MKYCKYCGEEIDTECVVCPKCGKQIEQLKNENVVINNNVTAVANGAVICGTPKNKWVSFFLCFFLGIFGAHKFYEGKILMGFVYLFTLGLFFIGWIIDIFAILSKPNPYYV